MGRFQPNASNSRQFLDIPLANASFPPPAAPLPPPALHLSTTREDSTRVQLQKQRLREQHHAVVVSQRIPGFRTSAAFFASLRTNLRLNASPPSSPWSTPPSMRASTGSLPPPSPLSAVMDSTAEQEEPVPHDPLAGVPELTTYCAESEDDKVEGLRLVADSVAQMRQNANSALIWHPLNLAVMVATMAIFSRYLIEVQRRDIIMAGTGCTGLLMAIMVFYRWLTNPYLEAAEQVNFEWLGNADIFITKFGEETIGALIIDWITEKKRKKPQRGEIKGWTVRLKYRGKGVGTALLEAAVQESKKKGADTVMFAEEHANSKRILPGIYNGKLEKGDAKARDRLQDLLQTSPARSKKK